MGGCGDEEEEEEEDVRRKGHVGGLCVGVGYGSEAKPIKGLECGFEGFTVLFVLNPPYSN